MIKGFLALKEALHTELKTLDARAHAAHAAKDIEKQVARLQYQKLQLYKMKVPTDKIDLEIEKVKKSAQTAPSGPSPYLNKLINDDDFLGLSPHQEKVKLEFLNNMATFLRLQREYTDLLERYNPGLTMDQEDKVRRTAAKVGLQVPE